MGAGNKVPLYMSSDERDFYSKTPKHVLFAICKDFAMCDVGEQESLDDPSLMLKEIKNRAQILKNARLLP